MNSKLRIAIPVALCGGAALTFYWMRRFVLVTLYINFIFGII